MNALDTNVLVRYLVGDDKAMMEKTCRLLEKAEADHERLLVTAPVLLETFWVLKSGYGYERSDIIGAVERLMALSALEFEYPDFALRLVEIGRSTKLGLPDLLIGLSAKMKGRKITWTFDKQASRSDLFQLIV